MLINYTLWFMPTTVQVAAVLIILLLSLQTVPEEEVSLRLLILKYILLLQLINTHIIVQKECIITRSSVTTMQKSLMSNFLNKLQRVNIYSEQGDRKTTNQ